MAFPLTRANPLVVARRRLARMVADPLVPIAVILSVLAAPVLGYLVATGRSDFALLLSIGLPAAAILLRLPFAGVLLWLLVMPYFVQFLEEPNAVSWALHRIAPLALLAVVAAYHALGIRFSPFRLRLIDYALVVFIVLGVLNVILFAPNPARMGAAFYDSIAVPILFFWLVRATGVRPSDLTLLLIVGLWTVVIQVAVGWMSWIAPGLLPAEWLSRVGERTTGTLGGPGPFTITLVLFSLLGVHRLGTPMSPLLRTVVIGVVGLALISVFMSLSRGSWLGGAIAVAGLVFVYPRIVLGMSAAAVVLVGILALGPLAPIVEYAVERVDTETTIDDRLITNDAAVRMIQDRPAFGFGFGNFERFDEEYKQRVGEIPLKVGGSAHNTYLNFAAEFGLPLTAVYFGVPLVLLVQSIRYRRWLSATGPLSGALLLILWLAIADQFIVSNFLEMIHSHRWGTALWWLTLGLIAVLVEQARAASRKPATTGWGAGR
jgi:O-antigen ligase